MDLFDFQADQALDASRPLAERMRPESLAEFAGQRHLTGPQGLIRHAMDSDNIFSMILWGPPGCGKTTLARIMARETASHFIHFSAVLSGVKDIRAVVEEARQQRQIHQKRTIVFVDEIHRFNKAQQDAFLHHVESGLITLIGATTENPSFEVIPPLLSRCRVITLSALSDVDLAALIRRALADPQNGLGQARLAITDEALAHLVHVADGDARTALGHLDITAALVRTEKGLPGQDETRNITLDDAERALQKTALRHDKSGEAHYNLISALHKSLRDSDPDAALYWLARMLMAGEDALYVARRMVRFATEDVGNADPRALEIALNAMEAFRFLGHPEGDLALAQAAVYLATAPKSNSIYVAWNQAVELVETTGNLPVPLHIRNAPTRLMKDLGYAKGYKYAHDHKDGFVVQAHLPEELGDALFYHPQNRGYEAVVKERLDKWRKLKKEIAAKTEKKDKAGR